MFMQIVQHLIIGGIESMAYDLCKVQDNYGYSGIISLEDSIINDKFLDIKDRCFIMNKEKKIEWKLILKIKNIIRITNTKVVHTHHIGPLLYGGLAAKLAGIKHIIHTEHDTWHLQNYKNRTLESILLKIIKPTLVANCQQVSEDLYKFFPHYNNKIINNGININKYCEGKKEISRSQYNLPKDKIIIGCVARLEKIKNHKILLEAIAKLQDNITLAIIGSGSMKNVLEIQAKRLNIENRVFFLGEISDTSTIYQAFDLFCLPSLKEGLPLSILEAESCNIPVIASNVGGIPEIIDPNNCILFNPYNIHSLLFSINNILKKKDKLKPRDFIINNFNFDLTVNSYKNLVI